MREVVVDADLCIASETCVGALPQAFSLDEATGVAQPTPGAATVPEQDLEFIVARCPSAAIRLIDPEAEQS
jgi:ferredoxin